ncbi:MAG TPA: zinc-binding dehydrogenase [Herpetosiphonaceae bacterium]
MHSTNNGPPAATMRALRLHAYDGPASLELAEIAVPRPGKGEVLVRIAAAPVNPSDLLFLRGIYGVKKPLPAVPGFEGSGTVVAAGPGALGALLVGKRVACLPPDNGGGTWAEYAVVPAERCLALQAGVSLAEGATMVVNPMTAWALIDLARREGRRAIVQTAAASAVGRMIVRLARRLKLPVINVVRRQEQADLLRGLGARHIVDSSLPAAGEHLRQLCAELGATLAYDAVAGQSPAWLLRALPPGGKVVIYGALSPEPCEIDAPGLIFERKSVAGFWLADWAAGLKLVETLRLSRRIQSLLGDELRTEIRERAGLGEAAAALRRYETDMTGGKALLLPNGPLE